MGHHVVYHAIGQLCHLPGRFGVRIEDVLVYTSQGSIDLTKSPKELIIL